MMIKSFEDLKAVPDLHEKGSNPTHKSTVHWWSGVGRRTTSNISPILAWYEKENRKRYDDKFNEIDANEILAALKGIKNKWSDVVKKHPESFKAVEMEGVTKEIWQNAKNLLG